MLVSFTIPLKPVSWNALVRKHYRTVTKLADEWKVATLYAVKEAKIKPFPSDALPIHISFTASWKGKRRHDIDSLYVKAVVDQLVAMRILPDDNCSIVRSVMVTGRNGQKADSLLVEIQSA